MRSIPDFIDTLMRKKTLQSDLLETELHRCLGLFDLIMMGLGHMIGAGIFVVTGTIAKEVAGPSIIFSYVLAGTAAFLSSLCYAEFGARVPRAGSAYVFTYITIGEFPAFMVGWNMILEYVIGGASVAKAWSGSLDILTNGVISNATIQTFGKMESSLLGDYLDFVAVGCILLWSIFIASGVQVSTWFNNGLTILNTFLLLFIISYGFYFADLNNWTNSAHGGFLPFGFSGLLAGGASCFYAFTGFESITIAGEETKNPSKHIPLSIIISVVIVTLLYLASSSALTLMIPYKLIDIVAPFPSAFRYHKSYWAANVIAFGAIVGLSASILNSFFTLPRIAYSIGADGLLFKPFAYIHPSTQTPLFSIIFFSVAASILALIIDMKVLVELLSIGTLFCYTMVSINLILLRYQPVALCKFKLKPDPSCQSLVDQENLPFNSDLNTLMKESQSHEDIGKVRKRFAHLPFFSFIPHGQVAPITLSLIILSIIIINILISSCLSLIKNYVWWTIFLLVFFSLLFLLSFLLLCLHEQNNSFLTFQVPLIPFLPVLSMVVNISLIVNLNPLTWLRMIVWIAIGCIIYFFYGMRNSNESEKLLASKTPVFYSSENSESPSNDQSKDFK